MRVDSKINCYNWTKKPLRFLWNFRHASFKTDQQQLAHYFEKHRTTSMRLTFKIYNWKYKCSVRVSSNNKNITANAINITWQVIVDWRVEQPWKQFFFKITIWRMRNDPLSMRDGINQFQFLYIISTCNLTHLFVSNE